MTQAPSPDAATLPPGHRVLEYRVEKALGGGGFGITYLAHDVNLNLPIALKEYFPGDLAVRGPDQSVSMRMADAQEQFTWGLERFIEEARALASFRHPNIVRVLRYFRENGTAYIVMEYESGDPLKRWLARQTSFDQKALLRIVYPLLDGLEAVHTTGFLHRDIKPDNIYVRADGTPVLLDFGAARRVAEGSDMTNVVSPGFAPFEQYHSRGNQGPWTDLYSLGAVMYWMTTGAKPMESASRVKHDAMPSAAATADALGYGEHILRAIDWAMAPDESRRPQTVAEFRRALLAAEDSPTAVMAPGTQRPAHAGPSLHPPSQPATPSRTSASQPASTSLPGAGGPDSLRRNVMATLLALDVVGHGAASMQQQVVLRTRFNELMAKALRGVDEASRVVVDGQGSAAICFLGDPEEALQSALLLRDLLVQKYRGSMAMRLGLHMGPVRIVTDMSARANVVGDGINVAQRVMDFAQPNQIVVSSAYYDVISRISDNAAHLFQHLGPHLDKHLRSHDIYAALEPSATPAQPRTFPSEYDRTAPHLHARTLTAQATADIEAELLRLIGPLARVLVGKTAPRAATAQELRELLAPSIPDAAQREVFLNPRAGNSRSTGGPSGDSRSTGLPSGRGGNSLPVSRSQGLGAGRSLPPGASRPATSAQALRRADPSLPQPSGRRHEATAEHLAQFEKALSQYIGPMARMIVRRESARTPLWEDLCQALAAHIDKPEQRAKFIAALKPPRS
jgi:serine/threonine protein kinase